MREVGFCRRHVARTHRHEPELIGTAREHMSHDVTLGYAGHPRWKRRSEKPAGLFRSSWNVGFRHRGNRSLRAADNYVPAALLSGDSPPRPPIVGIVRGDDKSDRGVDFAPDH